MSEDFFGLFHDKSKFMSQKDSSCTLNRRMLNFGKLQKDSLNTGMHMDKLPFNFYYKHRYSIRKATSSVKNRVTHSVQSTGTSKEVLKNSFSNNITTTNPEHLNM